MAISLFTRTNIPLLTKALDAYALRQKVIASNIANIGTVGYRAQTVTFEDKLASVAQDSAISGTQSNERHLPIGTAVPALDPARVVQAHGKGDGTDPRASGVNDVDIDNEMAALAEDQIHFRFAARMMTDAFRAIQKSIRGQA
jgi:flagellar basal-body rod protein FlgB